MFLEGCRNLTDMDKDLIRIFSINVGVAFDNIYLNREITDTQKEVIETIGGIIETRCRETGNHVKRVAEYAQLLARKAGIGLEDAEILKYAAPMHDVGKIGIPDAILNKPGKLTKAEFEKIKMHTSIGYQILKSSKRQIIQAAAIVANQHHERWDGKGYPNGLKGENIHIFGRIICLLDVFDAVSNERLYKPAWDIEKTLDYIRKEKGKLFDPMLVDIFMENIGEFLEIKKKYADKTVTERCL
jgi:response regulator RpfG family c-di-GMP phosphodiesterase